MISVLGKEGRNRSFGKQIDYVGVPPSPSTPELCDLRWDVSSPSYHRVHSEEWKSWLPSAHPLPRRCLITDQLSQGDRCNRRVALPEPHAAEPCASLPTRLPLPEVLGALCCASLPPPTPSRWPRASHLSDSIASSGKRRKIMFTLLRGMLEEEVMNACKVP